MQRQDVSRWHPDPLAACEEADRAFQLRHVPQLKTGTSTEQPRHSRSK
jgi:hypothetical protein